MAAGFPLTVSGMQVRNTEALYQACRFPHRQQIQRLILREASPMSAKMVGRKYRSDTRPDWDQIKVPIMRWCIGVKLAQHFKAFGRLLELTGERDIVEASPRDDFWGAIPGTGGRLTGVNALGRLLMDLRAHYMSPDRYRLLLVLPLRINHFTLLGSDIGVVDDRLSFLASLLESWQGNVDTDSGRSAMIEVQALVTRIRERATHLS